MDNYEKISVVGRGAHGTCFLCRKVNDKSGHKVLIKQIPLDGMSVQEIQTTLGEVKTLQLVNHPNIIGYYESFVDNDSLCIVMQFSEGGTLADMLAQRRGCLMEEGRVINYLAQIALSLYHLHSKQILHRDLKTQNILLNRAKTICKLSDFGISRHLESTSQTSTIIGTPCYLSPEICEGRAYNHKSDLWSLGCILYELVTLKRAFEAASLPALIMKITKAKYDPVGDHVSAPLRSLIDSLLSLNENRRPELADILTNSTILPVALRLTLELGTVVLPSPIKLTGQLTPNTAKRLRTRPVTSSAHSDVRTNENLEPIRRQRLIFWGDGREQPNELDLINTSAAVVQVACSSLQKVAITDKGIGVVWENLHSDCTSPQYTARLIRPPDLSKIISIACGTKFVVLLTEKGHMASIDDHNLQSDPRFIHSIGNPFFVDVVCGPDYCLCRTYDHQLYGWGNNEHGQLGMIGRKYVSIPTKVPLTTSMVIHSIVCGSNCSAFVTIVGQVWTTGDNRFNKLGLNDITMTSRFVPSLTIPIVDVTEHRTFDLGLEHSAFISDSIAYTLGNALGDLGDSENMHISPVKVDLARNCFPQGINAGNRVTAVVSDNQVYTFGVSSFSRLGRVGPGAIPMPVKSDYARKSVVSLSLANDMTFMCLKL